MTIFKKKTLNKDIETKLKNDLHYSDDDIATIKSSQTLVTLLNKFSGTLIYDPNYNGAFHKNGVITLGKKPYNGFSYLAHELAHAVGDYQASNPNSKKWWLWEKYKTAREYADDRERAEGEAIAYEYTIGKELIDDYHKRSNMWYDNATSLDAENYSDRIEPLLEKYSDTSDNNAKKYLYQAIGEMNADMITSGQKGRVKLTYDERNVIDFLEKKDDLGDLNNDYQQVMDKPLYALTKNGYPKDLSNVIHIKSLTNKSNGHYGENGDDYLSNHHDKGTALAQRGDGDLLYGGNGDDLLIGNSGKDILLGGDGADRLYGKGGDDIVGGNKGNDTLYGGAGKDILQGGDGFDNYYADNQDTITDSDGQGRVYLEMDNQSTLLTGGKHTIPYQDTIYKSDKDNLTYQWDKANDTLYVRADGDEGKQLTITNWHNNELGISNSEGDNVQLDIDKALQKLFDKKEYQDNQQIKKKTEITDIELSELLDDDNLFDDTSDNSSMDNYFFYNNDIDMNFKMGYSVELG